MWVLNKPKDGSTKYLITAKSSYMVGRKNCDIVLEDDTSVSRKHCTIYIAKKSDCPFEVDTPTGIWVVDEQSKYGTYVQSSEGWIKLRSGKEKKLTNGNVIKFGMMDNTWSVHYKPVIACASGVQTDQKKAIDRALKEVDGEFKNIWTDNCSLVIVNQITLTVKVVLALINGTPIVTPQYVLKLVESIKSQSEFPDYKNYRPEMKESILDASLISLDIKDKRKDLFKGKKFVIPTRRQLETLKEVILSAGGKVELLSLTGNWDQYAEEGAVVIQLPINNSGVPEELTRKFKEITAFLKDKHERRVVPESEIAQAVAYSTTEKYCNPESTCFNLRRLVKDIDRGDLLVEETPESTKEAVPDALIPSSSSAFVDDNVSVEETFQKSVSRNKRTRSGDPDPEQPKQKTFVANEDFPEVSLNVASTSQKEAEPKTPRNVSFNKEEEFRKIEKKILSDDYDCSALPDYVNFFKKKNEEKVSNYEKTKEKIINSLKRKSSSESDSASLQQKKPKLPEVEKSYSFSSSTVEEPKKLPVQTKTFESFMRIDNIVDENFDDYIGRKKPVSNNEEDSNNISYRYNDSEIFSSAFLKNGVLVEPPAVPVNVKRFKKQKVQGVPNPSSAPVLEEEILDGDWLDPHPLGTRGFFPDREW